MILESWVFRNAARTFSNALANLIDSPSINVDDIAGAVFISEKGKGIASELFALIATDMFDSVIPAIQGFGVGVALLVSFIGIIELAAQDRLTPELFVKHFAKFAVAFAAILFSKDLAYALVNVGNWLAKGMESVINGASILDVDIKNASSLGQSVGNTVYAAFVYSCKNQPGLGPSISIFMNCFWLYVPLLAIWVAKAAIFFIALTRGFELTVRGMFLPIPLGLLADDGWHGAGGRYVKKYLSVASQGMVIIAIASIMKKVCSGLGVTIAACALKALENCNIVVGAAQTQKALEDLGEGSSFILSSNDVLANAGVQTFVVPFGIVGIAAQGLGMITNSGVNVAVSEIATYASKASMISIAVMLAGVGVISKSLQICSDIWGA